MTIKEVGLCKYAERLRAQTEQVGQETGFSGFRVCCVFITMVTDIEIVGHWRSWCMFLIRLSSDMGTCGTVSNTAH